jgi:flavin reductase (DIM6/NTAB) family NADH-FMN oxidoreductase RutF
MDTEAAFSKVLNGIAVVTAESGGKANGMTAAWFTRASFNPPLVVVSVGKTRHTWGLIRKSGSFCLNVLSEEQVPLARKFGFSSGRDSDKLEGVGWKALKTGSPVIDGAAAWLDCKLIHEYEAGDHTLFVGEVVDCGSSKKKPLPSRMEDYS